MYSAYVSEVYRAGIDSIHPSQEAAARSLGLSRWQGLRFVVLPQAVRRVIPPLLNDFIGLQKDTVLVASIGVVEVFRETQILQAATFNFTPYLATALIFLVVTIPLARLTDWLLAREKDRRIGADAAAAAARVERVAGMTAAREAAPADRPATAARRCRSRACTSRSGTSRCCAGIDLEVAEHEVVALIGASGSGKSTLLRCVNLIEPIDAGRILIEGDEITAKGVKVDRIRRRIGIVYQAYNLFPHMRVLDNVTLAPRKVLRLSDGGGRAGGDGAADAVRPRRQGRRLPGPAVGRPAAAGRDRAGAGDVARPPAPRRGHLGPRPRARRRGPERDPGAGRGRA